MQRSLLKEKDGIIIEVNDNFLNLTQFNRDELYGKSLIKVLNELFRCDYKISVTNKEIETVLFTKNLDVRFINLRKHSHYNGDINLYIFNEIENSRLDNKLLFIENLINDNKLRIGIYTAKDMKLIKANQKYFDYLAKPFNTKEIAYGRCLDELIPNFEESKTKEVFTNALKYNKSICETEKQENILGENSYWDNTVTPISENGEIKYIMSILENVTEKILRKKQIQIKNKQLESIIESVEDIISIVGKDGKYLKHSSFMKKVFGENKDRHVGYSTNIGTYYDLIGNPLPLEALCFMNLLKGVKSKDQKTKYVYEDNEYYLNLNAIPLFDENGQFEMGVIVTHDITELVKNNKLISSQKKKLEIIFDNMSDALAVMDKNGNYTKRNKALIESINNLYNISLDRVGESISESIKYYNDNDEELVLKEFPAYRVLNGETVKKQRVVIKGRHGNTYHDFNGVPIFDENGDFEFGILLSHDITHIIENNNRIKLEQQLTIKSEKEKLEIAEKNLAMKDEFISLISHEFKTPLNVIYSAIQLIEFAHSNEVPNKVKGLMKTIKQNTFRQLRLVNNLLDVTRLNAGQFKLNINNIDIVSLTRQIVQSVKLYSNQKNIKLLFITSLNCKNIAIDDEKLERIILNLLSNAIKFTHDCGTVSISIDENKKTNMIMLEVSDTGIGIPKDKQELIFERFGQVDSNLSRHAEGTGIGLSLVSKLVAVLNGKIELESEPGCGSTFRIILPANQHIEEEKIGELFNGANRLVNALNVEFSDIYL